jgi:hypothetical protein
MRNHVRFSRLAASGALVASLAAATTTTARAEDPYPLVYGQRPIVLTKGLSQVEAAFSFLSYTDVGGEDKVAVALNASFDYGILENLTAGVLAVPLALSPDANYGDPQVYGTYRFMSGAFDLGAHLRLTLPVEGDFGTAVGVLARFFLNKATFINVGALLNITFADDTVLGLSVPIELAISFTRNLFFSVNTGFDLQNFDAGSWSIPLGIGLGYSIEGGQGTPLADIFLRFGFVNAITDQAAFENLVWNAQLGGRFFF